MENEMKYSLEVYTEEELWHKLFHKEKVEGCRFCKGGKKMKICIIGLGEIGLPTAKYIKEFGDSSADDSVIGKTS